MATVRHLVDLGVSSEGGRKQFVIGGSHGRFLAAHLIGPDYWWVVVDPIIQVLGRMDPEEQIPRRSGELKSFKGSLAVCNTSPKHARLFIKMGLQFGPFPRSFSINMEPTLQTIASTLSAIQADVAHIKTDVADALEQRVGAMENRITALERPLPNHQFARLRWIHVCKHCGGSAEPVAPTHGPLRGVRARCHVHRQWGSDSV
ncbi:hypothetical protein C8F01DRAFT_662736 [Mycena amicta]|nr:hypothetical protein C8F01DRAFT_662736 [Mycena amicta]